MTGRIVVLGLLLICVAADVVKMSALSPREPSCPKIRCTRIYSPVCGSDGQTYDNECLLCVQRQRTNTNIQVLKEDRC